MKGVPYFVLSAFINILSIGNRHTALALHQHHKHGAERVQMNVEDVTHGLRKLEVYTEIQTLLNKHIPKPKKGYRSLGKDEIMNAKHLVPCQRGPQ